MTWRLLSAEVVEAIHDAVLNESELPGRARDESLESALARVDNRLAYGMIGDVFDLAAAYADAIARGHFFNDANKRAAYEAAVVVLELNGTALQLDTADIGPRIVALAQGALDPDDLAARLRRKAGGG
ncbi:type II toxin-antitoxin system death-on-curing family toxin [Wenxinia marina]|uniref:Death-on-curing family protein n=1 Tax=Wenxinia marina DSM 24838 TaxID=1123501 RepID=A0A0D0PHC6_9RHOB|nr:type II toxin-antitoxin system death-on-curing family toxin [Wenxinia marina]KIQ70726.1 death-on-curing family protein [Wenxinia marina DSM 24838]GGL51057.1 hypothetical protein GCM10011392_01500 [Wenxinia marina]